MQNADPLPLAPYPPPPPGLPLFAWAIPAGLEWWDLAGRDPCQPVARDLLQVLVRRD